MLRARLTVEPGGTGPPRHVHPVIEEEFHVESGEVDDDGAPGFLQAMVFARQMRDVLYLVSPPYPVQRALWPVFAPLGRALGYRATYDRYLRPGFWEDASLGQGSAGPGPGHQESHAGV